jgi:hypothetical protein
MSKSKRGWEKLKDAQIKKKKETEVLKKVIPLTSYFKPIITLESDNLNTTVFTSSIDSKTINISEKNKNCANNDIVIFSNDPGTWNVNSK